MTDSKITKGPWLHAWYDPLAGIKTVTPLVRLADLHSDGDSKLLICDLDKKLRVYKGTALVVEHALLDSPVSMCVTYTENHSPPIPSVAVAAGSHIFIYKHLRPSRKWSCPPVDISDTEKNIWEDLKSNRLSAGEVVNLLNQARDSGCNLSSTSLELLMIENESKREEFIEDNKKAPLVQNTLITCMEVIKKASEDSDAVSLLVVGTESGVIYILPPDPSGSTHLCRIQLESTPTHIAISGLFETEWRAVVACRDGRIYNIKDGDVRGSAILTGNIIDTGAQIVAIAKQDKVVWAATMDRMISCYTIRGKRLSGIAIRDDDVTDIAIMNIKRMQISHALLVALSSGELRMYHESRVVHSFNLERPIIAMRFGTYGREDNSLAVIHGKGAMTIKIMRRSAEIDTASGTGNGQTGPPPEQDIPLNIPKKTKLFVEQTQREREQFADIHRAFQRDLSKMRLETARGYVNTLTMDGLSPMGTGSAGGGQDIRIHAQVKGLGPRFQLCVYLQNVGQTPVLRSRLMLALDPALYSVGYSESSPPGHAPAKQCIHIPILLPGPKHVTEIELLSIDPQGRAGQVLVLLGNSTSASPVLAATVRMPISEPEMSF